VNSSPDAPALDFYIDDRVTGNSLAYLGASPAYVRTDPEEKDLSVTRDGSLEQIEAKTFTFANDRYYAILTIGKLNFTEFLNRIQLVELEINVTTPIGNTARIIPVNAFLRADDQLTPNVDIRSPGDNPAFRRENIAYATAGASFDVPVNPNAAQRTLEFVVRRNGSDRQYIPATVGQTVRFTPESGRVYLAMITGIEGQTGAQAPQIRFIRLPIKED
jgi:hypothetical protein